MSADIDWHFMFHFPVLQAAGIDDGALVHPCHLLSSLPQPVQSTEDL